MESVQCSARSVAHHCVAQCRRGFDCRKLHGEVGQCEILSYNIHTRIVRSFIHIDVLSSRITRFDKPASDYENVDLKERI
jgi:hypothetical protein